jgi:hypothetical protein
VIRSAIVSVLGRILAALDVDDYHEQKEELLERFHALVGCVEEIKEVEQGEDSSLVLFFGEMSGDGSLRRPSKYDPPSFSCKINICN